MAKGDFERKVQTWAIGRNGQDDIVRVCLFVALVLIFVNFFVNSAILSWVALGVLVYGTWRTSSKNVPARRRENEAFMKASGPLRPWIVSPRAAWKELRGFKHLKCPKCGQRVRVPRGKGTVRVTCPKCHEKFDGKA